MSIFVFCYNNIFKFIDKGLLEHSGPHFFALMIEDLSLTIKKMQTGYVYRYGYFMVLAYTVVVIILDSVN